MISRRRFISILMMITALFLLFQGPQIIRERWNQYGTNKFAELEVIPDDLAWDDTKQCSGSAVFLGSAESDSWKTAAEWALYTKRKLYQTDSFDEILDNKDTGFDLVIIDKELWNSSTLEADVRRLTESGIPVLFSQLPDYKRIDESEEAKSLLGIQFLQEPSVTLEGIHLFEGFFLGGERIYQPVTEEENYLQDLDLEMTWYVLGARTETYMMGMVTREGFNNEYMPPVIWSCWNDDSKVYAIEGEYFSDHMIGIGILDAVLADVKDYFVYPCINSQQFSIVNFPDLSDENKTTMQKIYSRNSLGVLHNIVLPGLISDVDANQFQVSAYIMPEYDYSDQNNPVMWEISYYLQKLGEVNAEACYSTEHNDTVTLEDKLGKDLQAFQEVPDYRICAVYATLEELEAVDTQIAGAFPDVRTISTPYTPDSTLISFLPSGRTRQVGTAEVTKFTYTSDLEQIGAETALGYANIQMDLKKVIWPQDEEDYWEKASKRYFSVADTYWKNYSAFTNTTATLADQRARNLLALSYTEEENDDGDIVLHVEGFSGEAPFIFRIHGRSIVEMSGGTFKEIEKGAWLLTVTDENAVIKLSEKPKREG